MARSSASLLVSLSAIVLNCSLVSCDKSKHNRGDDAAALQQTVTGATGDAGEAAKSDCLPRMKQFLNWYLAFIEKPDTTTGFINFPVTPASDSAFVAQLPRGNISKNKYMGFNRVKAQQYLDALQESNYFSQSFLSAEKASLFKRGADLDATKIEDGLLNDFAGDEVFWTQELFEKDEVSKLTAFASPKLKPGTFAFRFYSPTAQSTFYLYVKEEDGLCVLDSANHDGTQ